MVLVYGGVLRNIALALTFNPVKSGEAIGYAEERMKP
jgi:hypothetical protein